MNTQNIFRHLKKRNQVFASKFNSVSLLALKSLLVFFLIAVLCRECFKICLLSYNKRAYGYYVSHLAKKEVKEESEVMKFQKNN